MSLLRPWQEASVAHLLGVLARHHAAADMSDGGTGKTYTAVSVARNLGRPTVVVCPKALIPAWQRVGKYLGDESEVINYEMARTGRTPYGRFKNGEFFWHREIGLLIFDEAHRCAGKNTLQSELLSAARRQNIAVLMLSATLADTPLELCAAGYALGLHDGLNPTDTLRDFRRPKIPFSAWLRQHGCTHDGTSFVFYGSREEQMAHMARIHAAIIPERGVRVRIADLGNQFPTTQITAELYDISDPARVDGLYAEMESAIAELHRRAEDDCQAACVRLLRVRQELELLKVPVFVELAQDAQAQGQHTAIFVNFSATLEEICERLGTGCRVDGSQVGERGALERQRCIDHFQQDRSPWIVCNNEAGGVGLSLHGKKRLSLISPGFSGKIFRQVVMRVHRDGGEHSLQRAICLAGTVEERVAAQLTKKLNCLDALVDGDLMPQKIFEKTL